VRRGYPLEVVVANDARLNVIPEREILLVKPGSTGSVRLDLNVIGVLTDVRITARGPNGWKVHVAPDYFPRLGGSGGPMVSISTPVQLTVTVPSSTPAGTYTVTVEITSGQVRSRSVLTVRVERGSGGAYLGIIILVVVFGLVMWMMRRVGRR
jgi:uncharacterized membrane protein